MNLVGLAPLFLNGVLFLCVVKEDVEVVNPPRHNLGVGDFMMNLNVVKVGEN